MSEIPEGTILVDSNELVTKLDSAISKLKGLNLAEHNFSKENQEIVNSAARIHTPIREHLKITHKLDASQLDSDKSINSPSVVIQQLDETINKFKSLLREQKEKGDVPEKAPYYQIVGGALKINKACAFVAGEVDSILNEVSSIHIKLWETQVQEVNREVENILNHANKVHLHLKEHLDTVHAGEEPCEADECSGVVSSSSNKDPFDAVNEATIVLEKLRELVNDHIEAHA